LIFSFLLLSAIPFKSSIFAVHCQYEQMLNNMMFTERIKQLREEHLLPQRKLAVALNVDTATYCKYEKGERRPKREQVVAIAELLQVDRDELLTLWLADYLKNLLSRDNDKIATNALQLVHNQYNTMNTVIEKPTFNPTDTLIFSTHKEDGITGITFDLVFIDILDKKDISDLQPKYYAKQLQHIAEKEAEAIIYSHCYGARQMLEVAGFSHLITDAHELD
jgi:transcriptional regulator with XRE-family HTH domain